MFFVCRATGVERDSSGVEEVEVDVDCEVDCSSRQFFCNYNM